MDLSTFSFFNPAPDFREMSILRLISQQPAISQSELAKRTGIVPSMVNKYIYQMEDEGYLVKVGENRRKMTYQLTGEGKFRLQFLTISYLHEVSQLYTQSHDIFLEVLREIEHNQIKRLYLYGAGIIGGVIAEILRFEDYEILGYVDDAVDKTAKTFYDYPVYQPGQVKREQYDGVIIASFKHAEQMYLQAVDFGMKNIFCFEITEQGTVRLKKMGGEA